ncbi:phosphohydrolase [Kitasatospora sp. MMS16-BH015]|nr:phosphohydrolase [Kitasatospora sp. MMS16-BH015]
MTQLSVAEVDALAEAAHRGQADKTGAPYIGHVRAVAAGLAPLGAELEMAGLLHDVIEDTEWTAERLLAAGVPAAVVETVEVVTKRPGVPYEEMIRAVAAHPAARLVKIADNAHNSLAHRAARLPFEQRERLAAKYAAARRLLWPAVDRQHLETVLWRVNPALLAELPDSSRESGGSGGGLPTERTAAGVTALPPPGRDHSLRSTPSTGCWRRCRPTAAGGWCPCPAGSGCSTRRCRRPGS